MDFNSFEDMIERIGDIISGSGHNYDLDNLQAHLMEYGIDLSQFSPEEIREAIDYAVSGEELTNIGEQSNTHISSQGNNISFEGIGEDSRNTSKSELLDKLKAKHIDTKYLHTDNHYGGFDSNSASEIKERLNEARDKGSITDTEYKEMSKKLKDSSYWS